MPVRLQKMNDVEVKKLAPFDCQQPLSHCYFVDFPKKFLFLEDVLQTTLQEANIDFLYFYIRFNGLMEDNVTTHCRNTHLTLNYLADVDGDLYVQIDIRDVHDLIHTFPLIELITHNMDDLTLFSTAPNLQVVALIADSLGDSRTFTVDHRDDRPVTLFVPEVYAWSFSIYSNDYTCQSEALSALLQKIFKQPIELLSAND